MNEQFDTSTAIGEVMLRIILVFAELERKMTSERVSTVIVSRANGGKIPYGYDYDKDTRELTINEDEVKVWQAVESDYHKEDAGQPVLRWCLQIQLPM